MKLARASKIFSLVALATIVTPYAMADAADWYIGANVGQSRATIDNARITSGLLNGGLTSTSISDRDRSTGYKIFGGYQVNKNIAVEGGYFDLGKFGFTSTTSPAGTLDGNIKLRGLNLDLVGTIPLSEKFSILGRAGMNFAQARDTYTGSGAVLVSNPHPSKNAINYKVGMGVQYALTDALAMRAEVERYRINDAVGNNGDVDLVSVGLIYRFGAKTPSRTVAPEVVATAPMPIVAAAPAPQPAPAPAPVRAAPKKVSFSADAMYDFDKSELKPEGKAMLDGLVRDLKNEDYDAIVLTGNADRIGSDAYNQKLSERRAESVKAYLISQGIPADRLYASGNGENNPETKPGDCTGPKSRSMMACLQADRRVDVEMTGTMKK